MNYFVAYPIAFDCNLHCSYCFHAEHHATNFALRRKFTIDQYKIFRDTHLTNADDIIVHFHGGESFIDSNINTICTFLRCTEKERVDILTNGLQPIRNYRKIFPFKKRLHRIGVTFHRKLIAEVPLLVKKYEETVLFLHNNGIPVYVKELLFVDERDAIRKYRAYWREKGIDVKIQDFKGTVRGRSFEEFKKYEAIDYVIIDSEYQHGGEYCSCVKNYKNILIRGGWRDGDVVACFEDPVVVGNIQRNEYNPNYKAYKDFDKGRIDVIGVPKVYKGMIDRDIYIPKACGTN